MKTNMKNPKSHVSWCAALATVYHLASFSALAVDYGKPAEVKDLLERTMRLPQPQPASIVTFYSDGISHFDGFIPWNPSMRAQFDAAKAHYSYTYHDGRLTKCEFFDASGKLGEHYPVWNNTDGGPVLSADFGENGVAVRYLYAEYDASGRIHLLYHFNGSFALDCYDEFTYDNRLSSFASTIWSIRPRP